MNPRPSPDAGHASIRLATLALIALASAAPAAAQSAPPDTSGFADRPAARASRTVASVSIDGALDEDAWQAAAPITHFTQRDPFEGQPSSQPTVVRVLYDDDALYIGVMLYDSGPVSSRLGRRDADFRESDWFTIAFDSYHDHLRAFRFRVNPSGVRGDEVLTNGNDFFGDDSWDPIWEAATTVTDSGWIAELRIPFSQIRFPQGDTHLWGLQIQRSIGRLQEQSYFAFTPKDERGGIARFGHLFGLTSLTRGRGVEVLPYLSARAEYLDIASSGEVGFGNPFRDGSDWFGGAGVDVKLRPTSDLTIDATLNPDFGQVEVDPGVVNLTAFETRFDEKRPFFVAGADLFRFGGGGGGPGGFGRGGVQLLYSRRIGAPPRGSVPDGAVYSDVPESSTILSAAKLTMRTAGGWSVGVLEALTGQEHAGYMTEQGEQETALVAPLANHVAARVQRSLRGGQTTVGAMATAVNRRLNGDSALSLRLRSSAYTGGADFQHDFANRTWTIEGHVAGSAIAGSADVIESAQRSSARYYQRPDADHLTLDEAATSLYGWAGRLRLARESGTHLRGSASLEATSPGFEINDLGFQMAADRIELNTDLRWVENTPGSLFRNWSVSGGPDASWNFGGDRLSTNMGLFFRGELRNYWSTTIRMSHDLDAYSDRLTRGGPLTRSLANSDINVEVRTDSRRPWIANTEVQYEWDAAGGSRRSIRTGLELKPMANLSVSLRPRYEHRREVAQYLGRVEDATATSTFGNRYVFADLRQTTLSMETRVNLTFSPDLTLEIFAQPLLATAAFGTPKQLAAARSFDFDVYGQDLGTLVRNDDGGFLIDPDGDGPATSFTIDDDDFTDRSLRGNAVLRWEWRPGSTLFLVWQQRRSAFAQHDDFRFGRDARALFDTRPENVFVLKASYWISP